MGGAPAIAKAQCLVKTLVIKIKSVTLTLVDCMKGGNLKILTRQGR